MKILYLSCHAILEYDELKLFEDLGIDYFSLGSYLDPQNPVDGIRPALTKVVDPELYKLSPNRDAIPKEFFDRFDVIIVMHIPEWIINNWENMKHKKVIWRTIGQSTPSHEAKLTKYRQEGLKIVRYSPAERKMNNFIGEDALIRFYKDPAEFGNWNGNTSELITFAQNMPTRSDFCNYRVTQKVMHGFNAHIYGNKNDEAGELNGGYKTYDELKQIMRDSRVYFYTGTQPASYTISFMEAWMTGIPVVAIGQKLWNNLNVAGDVYEVHELIENGVNGYVSDDIDALRHYVELMLNNRSMAEQIGITGRKKAISIFGKDNIKKDWQNLFNSLY